jgi:hypothetical protein
LKKEGKGSRSWRRRKEGKEGRRRRITKKINFQAETGNVIHIRHKPYTGRTLLGLCIAIKMKYHCNMQILFV